VTSVVVVEPTENVVTTEGADEFVVEVLDPAEVQVVEGEDYVLTQDTTRIEVVEVEQGVEVTSAGPIEVVTAAEQGPEGIQGPPGSGSAVTRLAGVALGGHRVVVLDSSDEAIYADHTILAHRDKVLGLTNGAVAQGDEATIVTYGEVVEPSWNWTLDDPVFLGTNGMLTQVVPTTGFLQRVGFPNGAPTKLFVDIDTPITL